MLIHYLRLAQKNLIKHKYYNIINVLGLVCGMLSALVIAKYIGATLQFDSFHLYKDRIYNVSQQESVDGNVQQKRKTTYLGMADLTTQFPEVAQVTQYYQHTEALMIAEDQNGDPISFTENKIFITDSSFLKIFTFPLVQGLNTTTLSRANAIVLTKSASLKYFGNANAIGKTLTIRVPWGQEGTYEVTGVIEDLPKLSQFRFDFLIIQPGTNVDELWTVPDYSVYLLLKENTNTGALAQKLSNTVTSVPQLKATSRKVEISLTPLSGSQLSSTAYLLATVGIFIMLISWTNYINQVIAQSYWRIKQVGIQRIMGATSNNLKIQFIVESSLTCLTSMVLIIGIYSSLEQPLLMLTDGCLLPLAGDPTSINLMFAGVFAAGIIIAATIQGVVHFSQQFRASIRTIYHTRMVGAGLRKALVVVQFSISTILLISIFVIINQLRYLSAHDKGVDMNDILIVKSPMAKDTTWNVKRKTLALFKQRCAALPFVANVASSTTVPGEEYRHEAHLSVQHSDNKVLVHQNGVDDHFFSLYDAEFIAGHDFIPDAANTNRSSIILNESAAKALGITDYENAINNTIVDHDEPDEVYNLIGIIKDYHQTVLRYQVRPMAFKYNVARGHCSLKIKTAGLNETQREARLTAIKQFWKESYTDAAFNYFFLREKYEVENLEDRYFERLFSYFAALSVVISCLGLFGLSLLISAKRQKEIGIRKAFGASAADILALFLKGYLAPLCIALLAGIPTAYLMMNTWLTTYAYRIDIGAGIIVAAIGTLTVIFLGTISYSTIKSSMTNPVKVLGEA